MLSQKEYYYQYTSCDDKTYGVSVLVLKNTRAPPLKVDVNATFLNEDKAILGAGSQEINVIEKGQEIALVSKNSDGLHTAMEYAISSQPASWKPIFSGLEIEVVKAGLKAIVSVTNQCRTQYL